MEILKNKNLGFKISFYFLTISIVVLLAIYSVNYFFTKEIILESTKAQIANLTNYNVSRIEGVLQAVEMIPENLSKISERADWSFKEMNQFMKKLVGNNPEIYGGAIAYEPGVLIDPQVLRAPYFFMQDGIVTQVELGNDKYYYPVKDWYQIPKYINRSLWSEPYFDEGGGGILMSTYSVPFFINRGDKKVFAGIMTADISIEWLREIIENVKILDTGYGFLLSRKGTFLSHPDSNYLMNESIFSLAQEYNLPRLRNIGRSMISMETGFHEVKSFLSDEESFLYYTPMLKSGWTFGVVFPKEELYAELNTLNRILIIIGFFGVLVLFALIIFVSNKSLKPLFILSEKAREIGQGNFEVDLPIYLQNDEVGKLTNSMHFMIGKLNKYVEDLKYTTSEKQRIESELEIAHNIQMGMVPKIFPPFPERDEIDVYAIMEPAKEVGGDLYDYFFIDEKHLCFAIGDVSGKGVPASLLMAVSTTLLKAKAHPGLSASELLNDINIQLKEQKVSKLFVTFFLAILNVETGEMEYTNAGHNCPFIVRNDGGIEQLGETHGLPIGLGLSDNYGSDTVILKNKDKVVMFTDGISEAMNGFDEMFDYLRIKKNLAFGKSKDVKATTEGLLESVNNFVGDSEQYDDMTILTLQYFGK